VSTIKSSAEHLTINADGALKDIILQNNGSTKVTVKSDGKVGVGTASPSKQLHIYNTASADVALLESTQVFSTLAFKSSTNSSTVTFGIDGAGNAAIENKLTSKAIALVTGGSEKLRIQSGGGISFNGDTAAANALDDYEEGTWTPSFTNPDDAVGTYTKVGNYVYCTALISCTGVGGSGINIGGLPFTPLGGTGERGGGSIIYQSADSTAWNCIVNAASQVSMYAGAASKSLASGQVAYFSFSYRAA
jgi:hypothetical protein